MAERFLTLRELNRATLARQFLLERADSTPLEVLERLVGMQAQNHNAPYIGLWTRLRTFQRAELTRLLESRDVVKAALMRSTLHLMVVDDYVSFRPVLQSTLGRALQPFFATRADGPASDTFKEALRAYLREQPRTGAELSVLFQKSFPGLDSISMNGAMRAQLPLVQVFPSGTWGFTGKPAYTDASSWLERQLADPQAGLRPFVLRYLAAFGPASVKDMQTWSGLTRLQETIDSLLPELLIFRDEQGRELFDLPDAPRPNAETPAPVCFLPMFDNLLLSYADRRRIIRETDRPAVFTINGQIQPTLLIDGFVRGIWKTKQTRSGATLLIELFEPLTSQIRREVLVEGEQLMHWMLDGTQTYEIQIKDFTGCAQTGTISTQPSEKL